MSLSKPTTPAMAKVDIWIVIDKPCNGVSFNSKFLLDTITVLKTDSGRDVVGRVKDKYFKRHRPYRAPVISIVAIPHYCIGQDSEAQRLPYEIAIENSEPSVSLTQAFRRPATIRDGTDTKFVDQLVFETHEGTVLPTKAVMIKTEFNALGSLLFILGVASVVACLGVAVGIPTHRADLGLAAAGGVLAAIICVEAFLFWKYNN